MIVTPIGFSQKCVKPNEARYNSVGGSFLCLIRNRVIFMPQTCLSTASTYCYSAELVKVIGRSIINIGIINQRILNCQREIFKEKKNEMTQCRYICVTIYYDNPSELNPINDMNHMVLILQWRLRLIRELGLFVSIINYNLSSQQTSVQSSIM